MGLGLAAAIQIQVESMANALYRYVGVFWLAAFMPVLVGCRSNGSNLVSVKATAAASIQSQLQQEFRAEVQAFPKSAREVQALTDYSCLVFLCKQPDLPVSGMSPATLQALHQYVTDGGKILLLGFASRMAFEMGVEPVAPDRYAYYRWGDSAETLLGQYEMGLHLPEEASATLQQGLRPVQPEQQTYLIAGGEMVNLQSCHWESAAPENAQVLGRLFRIRDGEARQLSSVVMAQWQEGRGQVLACGALPEPWRPDPVVSRNARRFLSNAVQHLCGGKPSSMLLCKREELEMRLVANKAAAPLQTLLPIDRRRYPGASLLGHWGWKGKSEGLTSLLQSSYRQGAGLLDAVQDAGQSAADLRALASRAHARGMFLQTCLPTSAATAAGDALPSNAAELLDLRLWGKGALDGFGLPQWDYDASGQTRARLRLYQPALAGYCLGQEPAFLPGFAGVQQAQRGRPKGVSATGISAQWRDAFAPRNYPFAFLDCNSPGSYPDWILTQLHDFLRPRAGMGAALWWPVPLNEQSRNYVGGLSMQGLKAAVAGRLSATGRDGYRQLLRDSLPQVQSGFGAESALPAATPFLQNNHFRLHGSDGALWLDPRGLAEFRQPSNNTRELSPGFMRSRWRGVTATLDMVETDNIDFVAKGLPARLDRDEDTDFPALTSQRYQATRGAYHLHLQVRAVKGEGIIEVRREQELIKLLSFKEGEGSKIHKIPFPVAYEGSRTLTLALADGGEVAIDQCRLLRRGSLAVDAEEPTETRVLSFAGHRAQLEERTNTTQFSERRVLTTIADFPGFGLFIQYDQVRPGLQVIRDFGFSGYRALSRVEGQVEGEEGNRFRGPFVLRAKDPEVPDLAVVPVDMPRYHHFQISPDGVLQMVGNPSAKQSLQVGFMFLRDMKGEDLANAKPILADLFDPMELDVQDSQSATVHAKCLKSYARLLRVRSGQQTPYLVKEGDLWYQRGAQDAGDGSDWLQVYHLQGATVELRCGEQFAAGTRPGIGSAQCLALQDLQPDSVTAHVYQLGPMLQAPSVVMGEPVGEVYLDGEPWSYRHGQTIYLPRAIGRYRIQVVPATGETPALARTAATVHGCRYDAQRGVLEIHSSGDAEQEYTAWVTGAVPVEVEGGELIRDSAYAQRTAEQQKLLQERGVMLRFRPGLMRIQY